MSFFVIDVGTSSMRGILYDREARVLMQKQILHRPDFLGNGRVEQDPETWKSGLLELCGALGEYCRAHGCMPEAVSLTAQRSSVIPVSADGTPLACAVMWQDQRTLGMERALAPWQDEIVARAGSRINPVFSGCKMKWMRDNEPELYGAAEKLIVIPDYLVHIMTGNFVTDTTYGSRSLLMNLRTGKWDDTLLEIFGVGREKLCDLAAPGSVCGTLTPEFAAQCGLTAGIPVVSAGGDQQCAALGLGVLGTGDAEITTGTGAFVLAGLDALPDKLDESAIWGASAVPGRYLLESSILTCCSAFDWFVRECYPDCAEKGYALVDSDMAKAEGTQVLVLPYFQGRATPDWNSKATASFHNVTLATSRGELARAILEGVCHEIRCNLSLLARYAGELRNIRIGGGLTKSPVFPQLEADVLQLPLSLYKNPEATALGAWIQAAMAVGMFGTYREAVSAARRDDTETVFEPRRDKAAFYRDKQDTFERLYRAAYGV